MARRILLYRSGALGDTLLTLPALDALKKHYPDANLTLAARPAFAAPLLDAGRVDAVIDAGSLPFHLLHTAPRGEDDLTRFFEGFDLIVLFTRDPEGTATRRLESATAEGLIASPFPPEENPCHIAEWMNRSLEPLSVKFELPIPQLIPSPETRAEAGTFIEKLFPGKFLALHPGAGGRGKWPPAEALAEIVGDFCRKAALPVLLIEGPADEVPCAAFRDVWGAPLPSVKSPRLNLLAGILARAAAYLGGDSGISHLAALCGAPALALFGPESDPRLWAPLGERAKWMKWDEREKCAARLTELSGSG